MNDYHPDNWVVIKFPDHYRLLAGWSGGYATGDSWRMNSGITNMELDGDVYRVRGVTGSWYVCHKDSYCLRKNNAYIWKQLSDKHGDKVSLMPEDTDWINMDWILK